MGATRSDLLRRPRSVAGVDASAIAGVAMKLLEKRLENLFARLHGQRPTFKPHTVRSAR